MTLQELLKSFELSDEQISQINQSVDGVIETKLVGKDDEIKAIEDELTQAKTDLDSANTELEPVRQSAQKEKLATLMPDDADPDKHADIVKLSGITDEDDDATIKSKLADTLSSRDYLKKTPTNDNQVVKTTTEQTKQPAATEDGKTQEMPAGVK